MSLGNKQKKRIKDAALMVSSLRKMAGDMHDINAAYSKELEMVLDALRSGRRSINNTSENNNFNEPNKQNTNTEIETSCNSVEENNSNDNSDNNQQPQAVKATVEIPNWAKDLYKKILKKCHPDKLDISNTLDFEIKMKVGKECMRYYDEGQYNYLIAIGGTVDIYTNMLDQKKQLAMLNKLYASDNEIIVSIQESISWKWGSSWEEINGRSNFLIKYCKLKKIKPLPNKKQILCILEELEKD